MLGLEIFSKKADFNNKKGEEFSFMFKKGNKNKDNDKLKKPEDYINLNTRISIRVNRSDYTGTYDSRVEDINKKHILISHPSDDGVPVPMLPGTKLQVEFVSNHGRFKFESEVIDKHVEGSLSFIQIAIPKDVSRNQLREFYRVPTNIKGLVKVYYAKVPDMSLKIPHKKVECKVVDISGGGGKLLTDAFMEKGQIFGLDMSSEIDGANDIRCTCIRSKRIQNKSEVSFKFNINKDSERNLIIQYVFKRQIELKQLFG